MAKARLTIKGDLDTPKFLPWVERHLRRLGLAGHVAASTAQQVIVDVEGPADLIDAMELGVSLGPIDAWIDSIERGVPPAATIGAEVF
jgi:acylphosphatase